MKTKGSEPFLGRPLCHIHAVREASLDGTFLGSVLGGRTGLSQYGFLGVGPAYRLGAFLGVGPAYRYEKYKNTAFIH